MNNISHKEIKIFYNQNDTIDSAKIKIASQEDNKQMEVNLIGDGDTEYLMLLWLNEELKRSYRIDDSSIFQNRFYIEGTIVHEEEWKNNVQEDDRITLNDLTEELFANVGL